MSRVDRASRVVSAPPGTVFAALVDRAALEAWLPPEGMRGRIEHWDPRPGGGFRMELTYLDATDAPGKSTDGTDVVEVGFADLVEPERVVQRAEFVADDPSFSGVMTMTWSLAAAPGGTEVARTEVARTEVARTEVARTEVTVTAVDVPPGIDPAVHEEGMASSLANLAAFLEGPGIGGQGLGGQG